MSAASDLICARQQTRTAPPAIGSGNQHPPPATPLVNGPVTCLLSQHGKVRRGGESWDWSGAWWSSNRRDEDRRSADDIADAVA
jgi:hypothetical protein